ncbi:MAG TPA: hypothetical protein DDX39_06820 [Bacteroidales bacterium]|nr:MAG: hypothetical protein A2W98_05900 [Bacteroidetes bacterium GWF2_33_38]OFY74458.1 MAG: hypothetical protein A2265_08285 [Bacteroidetes bacterium RIFOXYA12_FULL_33_9]HBF88340.1 hypothetical protein [Bacteroidales bacterium]
MKNIILLSFIAFLGISNLHAQFWTLDFETAGGYTTNPAEFTDAGDDYFTRTDGTNITGTYTSPNGSWFFAAQDINGDQSTVPCVMTINNIDISSLSGLSFKVLLAEDAGVGWDADPDEVTFEYNIDGGAWTNLIWVRIDQSEADGLNGPCSIDTDFDGEGDGTVLTNTFQEISANIAGTGNLLDIRITIDLTAGDEDIAFDNLQLFSTVACATPTTQASNIIFPNTGLDNMDISWTNGNGSNRIVKINTVNSFTNLVDGTSYTANSVYGGGEQIIYAGNGNSVSVTNLTPNTIYYVKVYEYSCTGASSLYLNSTNTNNPNNNTTDAPCSGATTQVSSLIFSNISDASFSLSWTSGDGDHRLVVVKQGSAVTSEPNNNTTYVASANFGSGSDIGTNEFVVYAGTGNSVTISGLDPETTYYVGIFEFCAPTGNGSEVYLTPAAENNTTTQADYPSSCFEIESILVDACISDNLTFSEGNNEMVRFIIGPNPLNVSDLTVTWPNNSFEGFIQNDTTAAITSYLNGTIQSCGLLIEPTGGNLPAGSKVLMITASDTLVTSGHPTLAAGHYFDLAGNSFSYLSDTLYIIFHKSKSPGLGGYFSNHTGSQNTNVLTMDFGGGCNDQVTVYIDSLLGNFSSDGDGDRVDFDWDGTDYYVNDGCQAPFEPAGVTAINVNQISNICVGESLEINGEAIGTYTDLYWTTSGTGTFTDPNSLNTTYEPGVAESGLVTLSLTAESGSCGTVTDTLLVTIYQLPTPTVSNDTIICSGDVAHLVAGGGTSYSWSDSLGASATVNASPTATTTYIVTVTQNGCSDTASVKVNINELPTVTASSNDADDSICNSDEITLSGGGATTYVWDNSVIDGVSFTPTATDTYTVTGTDVNGCENTDQITINITEITANAGSNQEITNGSTATLSGSATGGTAYTYSWEPTTSLVDPDVQNPTTISLGATTIFTLTVTDTNTGCQDTAQVIVTVTGGALSITAMVDIDTICENGTTNLSALVSGGSVAYVYSWSSNPAGFSSTSLNPGAVSPAITTTYTVVVTDAVGSTSTSSITVYVNPLPTLNLSDVFACTGETVTIGPSTTYNSYSWSTGATTQTIDVSIGGTFDLTVEDTNGCENTAQIVVNFGTTTLFGYDIDDACDGNIIPLSASSADTYLWSTGETTQTINVTTSGTYTVSTQSSTSCDGAGTYHITFIDLPIVELGNDTAKCTGESIVLETVNNSDYEYEWSNGGTTYSTTVTAGGSYNVTVTNNGCTIIDNIEVTFYALPEPLFGPVEIILEDQTLTLDAGNPGGTYIWSTTETTQSIEVTEAGNYAVTITDANTCVNTATVSVVLDAGDVYPYNVFTPNQDGYNDVWTIDYLTKESFPNAVVYVFNRNGNKVFESMRYEIPWDGKYNSKDLPAATYFYMIDLGDGSEILKGTVTIVR